MQLFFQTDNLFIKTCQVVSRLSENYDNHATQVPINMTAMPRIGREACVLCVTDHCDLFSYQSIYICSCQSQSTLVSPAALVVKCKNHGNPVTVYLTVQNQDHPSIVIHSFTLMDNLESLINLNIQLS